MRLTNSAQATLLFVATLVSATHATAAAPSAPSQEDRSTIAGVALYLGGFRGDMTVLQERCGHTPQQMARAKAAEAFMEHRLTTGGPQQGAAFREGVLDGIARTKRFLAAASPQEVSAACAELDTTFDAELKDIESYMPKGRATSVSR